MSEPVAETLKQCGGCKRMLPLDQYWRNKNFPDGLQRLCKECHIKSRHAGEAKRRAAKRKEAREAAGVVERVSKELFAGKPEQSEKQALRWVLDHLALEDVSPEDCPSAKAWFFFVQARLDADFARQLALKYVPTRTELSERQRLVDDDRNLTDRLAALERDAAARRREEAIYDAAVQGYGVS